MVITNLRDVIKRHEGNPLIKKEWFPFDVVYVLNPCSIKHGDEYKLICRVTDRKDTSHLALAKSHDGINFEYHSNPILSPEINNEEHGVEDPRITKIKDKYYITYTTYSKSHGAAVALLESEDLLTFEKKGIIFPPDNKNAVIFPEKIDGKYFIHHRPMSGFAEKFEIWSSSSPDLIHWGNHKFVMSPKDGPLWSSERIGAGAVPIKTDKGWLSIYHGAANRTYKLGVAIFDLENPSKLIRRSENFILSPETDYETRGWAGNVVFTCGAILEKDNEVKIYYSGADSSVCLATTKLEYLIEIAEKY